MRGNLVLTRRVGQRVLIRTSDGPVVVTVARLDRERVRLAIEADTAVRIWRQELLDHQPAGEEKS